MYDGASDNPGKTTDGRIAECSKACLSQKTPKEGKKWTGFIPKGFIVQPDGRCFCENSESVSCTRRTVNTDYKRYDWRLLGL